MCGKDKGKETAKEKNHWEAFQGDVWNTKADVGAAGHPGKLCLGDARGNNRHLSHNGIVGPPGGGAGSNYICAPPDPTPLTHHHRHIFLSFQSGLKSEA